VTLALAVAVFVAASQLGVGFSLRVREIIQTLPGDSFVVGREGTALFDGEALETLRARLLNLGAVVLPLIFPAEPTTQGVTYRLASGERTVTNWPLCFRGVDPGYFEQTGLVLTAGRVFSETETRMGAPVAVIGAGHAAAGDRVEGKPAWSVGDTIEQTPYLAGEFTVIGVLAAVRSSVVHPPDDTIYVPWTAYPSMLDWLPGGQDGAPVTRLRQSGFSLWVGLPDGRLDAVVAVAREALAAYDQPERRVLIAVESDLANVYRVVADKMSRYFWWVALMLLGLGAMQVSVLTLLNIVRRSREFAVLRALGAGPRAIMGLASAPVAWLALASGGLGSCLGVALAPSLGAITGSPVTVEIGTLAVVSGVLIAVALVAASLPARRVLSLDTLTALSESRVTAFRRGSGLPRVLCFVMIAVGVFASAVVWGLGAATEDQVDRCLRTSGYASIVIRPSGPLAALPETWTQDLACLLRRDLPLDIDIGSMMCTPALMRLPSRTPNVGASQETGFQGWALEASEPYLSLKQFACASVVPSPTPGTAFVGSAVATRLSVSPGDRLTVGDDLVVTVSGVLDDPSSDVLDTGDYDRRGVCLLNPTDFASCRSARIGARSGEIWVSSSTAEAENLLQTVEPILRSLPLWASQLRVTDMAVALREAGVLRADFATALAVVACLGILLGVSATSMVTVLEVAESRQEIGILRSIGASATFVRRTWLRRTVNFFLASGSTGIGLASIVFIVLAGSHGWSLVPGCKMGALALLLTIVGGLAAGWYPSSLAAKIDPLDCLRGE